MLALTFEGKSVRTVGEFTTKAGIEAEMGWVLADVAASLGIGNARDWARALDDDEMGVEIVDTPGGPQEVQVITEPGLYKVLNRSRKPEAKRFDRWVRHEVLPTIRKTGGYGITQQHGSDLCTLVGDAVSTAIRPILQPVIDRQNMQDVRQDLQAEQLEYLAGEVLELKQEKDQPLLKVLKEYELMPLQSWLHVNTVNKPPALPGLYRIESKGRIVYIGKADGTRGLLGRLDPSKHEAMKYLWHIKAPYDVFVCPTSFGGSTLSRAEDQLQACLRPDWEYGGVHERWRRIKTALATTHQTELF